MWPFSQFHMQSSIHFSLCIACDCDDLWQNVGENGHQLNYKSLSGEKRHFFFPLKRTVIILHTHTQANGTMEMRLIRSQSLHTFYGVDNARYAFLVCAFTDETLL